MRRYAACMECSKSSAMAGDFPNRQGYAGVTSQFPASGWARAELALNQDKSRLQLRRSGSPVNQARSFKFTACAVSDAPGALSPRSAAIVPGRRSTSPVLRGLKVGEIISVLRDRSPDGSGPGASESMVWPHRRGDENMIAANGFQLGRVERRARSASPPARGRRGDMEEARMVAMFAAVSTEQEVEVDVLNLGASVGGRDGRTRPLSPRVRESDWLDGLSSRMPERGGSRLFPTHLAKSAKFTGGPKTGGAFVVSGGAKVTGSAGSGTQSCLFFGAWSVGGAAAAMPVKVQQPFQPALEKFCREEPLSLDEVLEVKSLLESKGTLDYTRATWLRWDGLQKEGPDIWISRSR
eukprot:s1363_g13.t1